jgi:ribosomal protein RSM22 (predicted rRNA methylase)
MRLPAALERAIQNEASQTDSTAVARASGRLTEAYKAANFARASIDSPAARLAYLQARMPATYAANAHVFRELAPPAAIRSMLDLGAGPGTSMWAAAEAFPSIERFTLVERSRELAELGRRLAWHSPNQAVRSARWDNADVTSLSELEAHDLVVLSYVLGELPTVAIDQVLRIAWARASNFLVIIEPGTPRNFAHILSARNLLLESGAHPVAPCPHSEACPMAAAGDWCHFSERLQRSAEHRRIKSAALGYEDEKFSYFVASKSPVTLPSSRIVRHPIKHKGHVQLTLCTPEGLQRQTVSKSQKDTYKEARNAAWGDAWSLISGG